MLLGEGTIKNKILFGERTFINKMLLGEGTFINKTFTWGEDVHKQTFYLGRGRL